MSVRAHLTRRLVEALRDQGNNVTDIARLCNVSRQTVYDWLQKDQGAYDLNLRTLIELTNPALTVPEQRLLKTDE